MVNLKHQMPNFPYYLILHYLKITVISAVLFYGTNLFAQEQAIRAGSAGASELLINPFARSSGWGGSNVASVAGLEGQYFNVAGLASTEKTELIFTQTSWLQYGNEIFNANESVSSIINTIIFIIERPLPN